jgi:Zn-dependent protease with chaperone function
MATDFYQRQDDARRTTKRLVVMFVLAVTFIVGGTMAVAFFAVRGGREYRDVGRQAFDPGAVLQAPRPEDIGIPLLAGGTALTLISGGTLFKVLQLRGGGHVVAESLRGRRVFPDTTDPVERRLLNVVEEMALASGVPVPPVFLLDEEAGINAFAAGYSPSDAVVAVTRGCAEQLTRDELQGVVAHEFSHILNGDMRLNIRLIGLLFGILLVGLMGRIILRGMMNSGSSRRSGGDSKGNGALYFMLIGLALMVLGYVGTLIGNLIKAACRDSGSIWPIIRRADTRNPGGLAGAHETDRRLCRGSTLRQTRPRQPCFSPGRVGRPNVDATHRRWRIRRLDRSGRHSRLRPTR